MTQQEIIDDYKKAVEEYAINFLKSQGYRPKRTVKYMEGLRNRLAKKGLEFVVEVTDEEYKTPTSITGDEISMRIIQGIKCYIKPKEANCIQCKHFIFKMMMNGYHGICDNRQLGDGAYVKRDGYCEDFEKGRNRIYESERPMAT